MTEAQIKYMVNRFLSWKLPENFSPDGGISFNRWFNENTSHPMKHEPSGTNLFHWTQAEAMVRHLLEGLPEGLPETSDDKDGGPAFPTIHGYVDSFGSLKQRSEGLSLRDYFAGQALVGLKDLVRDDCGWNPDDYAKDAFSLADAMIAARKGDA